MACELDDNERYIYFFDTPELELFEQGVIARARRIVGAEHDSTIKFRPVDPDSVPALWRKYSGFKIEADSGDKGVVKSASLTMPVAKGQIKRVVAGKEPIASLFARRATSVPAQHGEQEDRLHQSGRVGADACLEMEIQ